MPNVRKTIIEENGASSRAHMRVVKALVIVEQNKIHSGSLQIDSEVCLVNNRHVSFHDFMLSILGEPDVKRERTTNNTKS